MDLDIYRSAKSSRPLWANALIVAIVALVGAALAMTAGMWPLVWLMLAAGFLAGAVAAVHALIRVSARN